jgi:hypothetical protein
MQQLQKHAHQCSNCKGTPTNAAAATELPQQSHVTTKAAAEQLPNSSRETTTKKATRKTNVAAAAPPPPQKQQHNQHTGIRTINTASSRKNKTAAVAQST